MRGSGFALTTALLFGIIIGGMVGFMVGQRMLWEQAAARGHAIVNDDGWPWFEWRPIPLIDTE